MRRIGRSSCFQRILPLVVAIFYLPASPTLTKAEDRLLACLDGATQERPSRTETSSQPAGYHASTGNKTRRKRRKRKDCRSGREKGKQTLEPFTEMDGELFGPRLSTARRRRSHPVPAPSRSDRRLSVDDLEGDQQLRTVYTCPFCFDDFDIAALCSHMDEKHCYDSRPVVCPVCAARVGKDLAGHITLQHGRLLKMQHWRKFHKQGASSSSTMSFEGKESREASLQALLEGDCFRSTSGNSIAVSDPLLSSFVCNYSVAGEDVLSKGTVNTPNVTGKNSGLDNEQQSFENLFTAEQREKKLKEETLRAKFLQHLVLSMIFTEC